LPRSLSGRGVGCAFSTLLGSERPNVQHTLFVRQRERRRELPGAQRRPSEGLWCEVPAPS